MTRQELAKLLSPALGTAARAALGRYVQGEADAVDVSYDEVRSWPLMGGVLLTEGVEFSEGAERIKVWV